MASFRLTVHMPPAPATPPAGSFAADPTADPFASPAAGPTRRGPLILVGGLLLLSLFWVISALGGSSIQTYPTNITVPSSDLSASSAPAPSTGPQNIASLPALKTLLTDYYNQVAQSGIGYVVTQIMSLDLYRTSDPTVYWVCLDYRIADPGGSNPDRIFNLYNLSSAGGWQVTSRGNRYNSLAECQTDAAANGGVQMTPPDSGPAYTPTPVPVNSSLASLSGLKDMITTYYNQVAQGGIGYVAKKIYALALYQTADQVYQACADMGITNIDGSDPQREVRIFAFATDGGWRVTGMSTGASSLEGCQSDLAGQGGTPVTPPATGPALTPPPPPVDLGTPSLSSLTALIKDYYAQNGSYTWRKLDGLALYKTGDQVYAACADFEVSEADGSNLQHDVKALVFNTNRGWRVVSWSTNGSSLGACKSYLAEQGAAVTPSS